MDKKMGWHWSKPLLYEESLKYMFINTISNPYSDILLAKTQKYMECQAY